MKVKVGDKIYDWETEPIMVILTPRDKQLIAEMRPDNTKHCQYPDTEEWTADDYKGIKAWMEEA